MAPQQGEEDCVPRPTTVWTKCHPSRVPYEVAIVMAAFFTYSIHGGILSIPGLYLKYFSDTFEAGKVTTTGVISVQGSLNYLSGLVVGPLIVRFGTQKVAVIGSLLASVGIFMSGFAYNISWLYIFYGAFTGFGLGILTLTASVSVQEHTNKRHALAATFALCGAGFGILIMPQIVKYAMIEYGERGSLLILGGIVLNTLPCTLLLKSRLTMNIMKVNTIQLKQLAKQRRESLNPLLKHFYDSSNDLQTGVVNLAYKEDAHDNLPVMINLDDSSSNGLTHELGKEKELRIILESEERKKCSVVNLAEEPNGQPEADKNPDNHSPKDVTVPPSSVAEATDKKASANVKFVGTLLLNKTTAQAMEVNGRPTHAGQQARPRTPGLSPISELNSKDITKGSTVDEGLHLSVVNLAKIVVKTTAIPDDSSNTLTTPSSLLYQRRKSLKEVMMPVSVDTGSNEFTISMALIIGAYFFWVGGFYSAFVFSPEKALSIGLGASEGAKLLSLSGIGNVGGRVVATFLSPWHDKLPTVIYIVTLAFTGISCALIGICRTETEMMMALIIFGMASVVESTSLRDIIGIRHFALILGYASVAGGIGNLLCIQLVSFISEKTSDISIPFSISGGLMATSALFVLAAFMTSVHTEHKNLKNTISDDTEAETHMTVTRF